MLSKKALTSVKSERHFQDETQAIELSEKEICAVSGGKGGFHGGRKQDNGQNGGGGRRLV